MSKRKQDGQDDRPRPPRQLRYLKASIVAKPPYCQGTFPLPDDDFTLFYGAEGNAQRINLSTASVEQLQHLADTCAPATFGVAGEDVYDETYRKACKLDNRGLRDRVRCEPLEPGGRNSLKASDGVMLRVLPACALDATLKILYETRWNH